MANEESGARSAEEMLAELQQARDEIRVQLHLLGMEAKDTFSALERKLFVFEEEAKRVSEEPLAELGESYAHLKAAFLKLRSKLAS